MITVKELLGENRLPRATQEMEDDAYDAHDDHIKKVFPGGETLSTHSLYPSLAVWHHGHSSIVKDREGNVHHVISITDPDGKTQHEVNKIKMHIPLLP